MNTNVIILFSFVYSVANASPIDPTHLRNFQALEEDCKNALDLDKEKTSNVLRTLLITGEVPSDYEGKCVASCIIESSELVYYNGERFVYDGLDENKYPDRRFGPRVMSCVNNVVFNHDKCEYGADILVCLFQDYYRQMAELRRSFSRRFF